ncbi:MAG: redoxin domain-containing protein [Myxococcales bacterium]|nr:redoxin domain-containing protein [Myxococcales bacterium]
MKTVHFIAVILPVTLAVGGCVAANGGSGATAGAVAAGAPLVATGGFTAEIDKGSFTVDYTGLTAKAVMQHRINKTAGGLACVPTAVIEVAQADGTCKLQLNFEAGFAGEGLLLKTASFTAKAGIYQDKALIQTLPCKGWTTEPAKGEVIYASAVAEGSLMLPPLSQPEAGMAKATLKNKALAMVFTKPTTMVFQGRKFTVDLSKISFKGDITSEGSDSVQCVKTFHEFPQWELMDINPGSKGFNTKYGLDAFKGKKVVVALVSDWCGSCLSQTKMMQDLQDKATAAGKDAVMIVINDKQKSKPEALTAKAKDIPIFQDEAGVDAWNRMNKGHEGKFSGSGIRNSGYGFAKNGEPIMYFEPNGVGSLNLTDFEKAVQTVLNAPDEK